MPGQVVQAAQQGGDDLRLLSSSTVAPRAAKRVAREIDAVEVAKILAAVLHMVVDLQRGAQRVRCRPGDALSPWTSSTKRPTGIAE